MELAGGDLKRMPNNRCPLLVLAAILVLGSTCNVRAQTDTKTIDLAKYCTDEYGPDAFVTRRLIDNARMCTLRTYGGLGLLHHVIDQASLCDAGTTPKVSGESKLDCLPGGGNQTAGSGGGTGGGSDGGGAGGEGGGTGARADDAGGAKDGGTDDGGDGQPLGDISGLWEVTEGGRIHIHMGEKFDIEVKDGAVTGRFNSSLFPGAIGRLYKSQISPLPKKGDVQFKGRIEGETLSGRAQFGLWGQHSGSGSICPDFPRNENNWQRLELRLVDGKLKGKVKHHLYGMRSPTSGPCNLFAPGEPAEISFVLTRTARVIEVTFTEAEPPHKKLKTLPLDAPFTITVKFDNAPGKDGEPVTLKNKRSGSERKLVADKTENPVIYRTREITLKPKQAEKCVVGC